MSQERISSAFVGVTWLLILSGLYVPLHDLPGASCKAYNAPKIAFSVVCALVSISSTVWTLYTQISLLARVSLGSQEGMLIAGAVLYYLMHLYFSLVLLCATSLRLAGFLSRLDDYQSSYRSSMDSRKARIVLTAISIVAVLSKNAAVVFMIVAVMKLCGTIEPDSFEASTLQDCNLGVYLYTMSYLQFYFELFRPASTLFLFIAVAMILGLEARRLNKELSIQRLEILENKPQYLESFRLRHGKLCSLIADASVFLRHFLFPVYVLGIPFMLLFVKGCADYGLSLAFLGWAIFDVIQVAVLTAVATLLGAWVSHQVRPFEVML
ncbi:hypothetical protein BaRGS_00031114 [Batillaria attramentaria]|uniref:G protein-coupled receptor n=1 Tax=Batillaria attramentaria TaxID=370345 RepID=A0ABD0JRB1_9CAEN